MRDLNPHGLPPEPKSGASASSANRASDHDVNSNKIIELCQGKNRANTACRKGFFKWKYNCFQRVLCSVRLSPLFVYERLGNFKTSGRTVSYYRCLVLLVFAHRAKSGEFVPDRLKVLLVGNAEPPVARPADVHANFLLFQKSPDNLRNQKLLLCKLLTAAEERSKLPAQYTHKIRTEPPHIHRNDGVRIQNSAVRDDHPARTADVIGFPNAPEHSPSVYIAHSPGHASVFAQGVFQHKTDQAGLRLLRVFGQVTRQKLKRIPAVIIVRIDHRKGTADKLPAGQNSLTGSPGSDTASGDTVSLRNVF